MCGLFSSMMSVFEIGVIVVMIVFSFSVTIAERNQLSRSKCNKCGGWVVIDGYAFLLQ